mgnify:CR=1 FL=1
MEESWGRTVGWQGVRVEVGGAWCEGRRREGKQSKFPPKGVYVDTEITCDMGFNWLCVLWRNVCPQN